jgi:YidC/Oxa1 family membrane protein insertase
MQARQSRRNAPNMNSQMAIVTSVLPIAFGLFSLQFPAGLVLYFLVSNLWRLGQQEIIMRKITRPGQAAITASQKDDVIDVSEVDTSAFPRAAGGLRKLFQIPAAANGGETSAAGGGDGNGSAKNGAVKPASGQASAAKGSGAAKSSSAKRSTAKGAQTSSRSSGSSGSSSRRRNNKKRKRR